MRKVANKTELQLAKDKQKLIELLKKESHFSCCYCVYNGTLNCRAWMPYQEKNNYKEIPYCIGWKWNEEVLKNE